MSLCRNSWSFFGDCNLLVFCMFYVFLKKILIDNRDIFYTYLLYRHSYTNLKGTAFKGLSCNVFLSDL